VEYLKIRKYRDNNGFTMIEVLVAIILIVIGILSVISLSIMVIKGNLQSKRTTIATTIAQEKIEDLIRQGHDAIATAATVTTRIGNADYRVLVSAQDDTPVDSVKTVIVDVWWGSGSETSSNKNVELQTIISQ
jgi:type IV pilus modification protein PilV